MNYRILMFALLMLNGAIASSELWSQAPSRNDGLLHIHQVERMERAFQNGEPLLDHWDPTIGLGYPFPRTYACFTHLLIWSLHHLSGAGISALYNLLVFLAWTLWPLSVYRGLSLLGATPAQALAAAWLAPLLHTSFRFGIAPESYFWLGYGLLPNLIGILLFPLALGFGVRFILEGRSFFPFLLSLSLTWFAHLITGYITTASLVLFLIFRLSASNWKQALFRLAGSGIATLGCCLFFLLPYLSDGPFINKTRLEPDYYWNSYPATEILQATIRARVSNW